ncbi:hypothetical protein OG413_42025 [Streptomyces sp. NBC_01433]|uniref:hypothetical protein n=1 Tax=Streptomyces sp. NBC_01433 TaxID=2903864 RepID=UPI0022560FE1|nr:hypothetical protein [Streptomyces sp. NBC_01433]MCX4681784.1 hypothetical protein [Streptomyces sp. NBC_01433]
MSTSGKKRKPSGFVSLLLLLTGVLLLYVSLPNLGNAARAATADGPEGTFTATRLTCMSHPGHETCEWSGSFRSTDGTVELRGVKLYGSGRDTFEAGQRTAAVDVGNAGRVYNPSGSNEWIFTALLLIAGYVLLAVVAGRHLMPPPLPRRTARPVSA